MASATSHRITSRPRIPPSQIKLNQQSKSSGFRVDAPKLPVETSDGLRGTGDSELLFPTSVNSWAICTDADGSYAYSIQVEVLN